MLVARIAAAIAYLMVTEGTDIFVGGPVGVLFVIARSPVLGSGKALPELEQAGKLKRRNVTFTSTDESCAWPIAPLACNDEPQIPAGLDVHRCIRAHNSSVQQ